jgi:uncharacterized protein YndB with AHSA1/START domain
MAMTAPTSARNLAKNELADDELLITRIFDAPLALVWRMWEDRDQMFQWWCPECFTCTSLDVDFRPGGTWRVHMVSDVYGESWSGGKYREIERGKRIVFTFAWEEGSGEVNEVLTTVTFEEEDGRTVQSFHQAPFTSVASRDGHVGGWNSLFNKEQAYAERLAKGERP